MSRDEDLFWELLELNDAILYLDNDCCYVCYNFNEDGDSESKSFDFGPMELVFMMADKLNIETESV